MGLLQGNLPFPRRENRPVRFEGPFFPVYPYPRIRLGSEEAGFAPLRHFEPDAALPGIAFQREAYLPPAAQGHNGADVAQVGRVRPDVEGSEARPGSLDAGNVLAHDGERPAAPGVVVRASAEAFVPDAPTFPQCGQRAVCHRRVAQFHPVERILVVAHPAQGLEHIFLHIGAGVVLLPEEGAQRGVEFFRQSAGDDGQGLSAVVGLALIAGRDVVAPVPILLVECFSCALCRGGGPLCFGAVAHEAGHLPVALQGYDVPLVEEQFHVLVVAPVAPCPSALAGNDQPLRVGLPYVDVLLHFGVDVGHRRAVARSHIVVPESVVTHAGQHLHRKLRVVVAGRDGREDGAVGALPVHQFADSLAGEPVGPFVEGVEGLARFVHHVAPPLGPLPVGAVHVGVPHRNVERALRFFPEPVQGRVVAGETAGEGGGVSRLPVFHFEYLHAFGIAVDDVVPVHPPGTFELLHAVGRRVFGKDVRGRSAAVVVGQYPDALPPPGLEPDERGDLGVIGQVGHEHRVAPGFYPPVGFQAEVFPLGNRSFHQPSPPGLFRGYFPRFGPCRVVETGHGKTCVPPGVEADVRLGQPVVGLFAFRAVEGRMPYGLPLPVRADVLSVDLQVEGHPRRGAVAVAESVFSEVPYQYGYRVLPLFERGERGQ